MKPAKDNFSSKAKQYKKYRPDYPAVLYEHIFIHCKNFEVAWDCATGNGQVAQVLSQYFDQVIATDISEEQLSHAPQIENVQYKAARSEASGLPDKSVNLITIGQAIHWFDFDLFYKEATRVLKKDGVIAAWTYGTFRVNPKIDAMVDKFYTDVVGPFWDEERKFIDQRYETIPFPFKTVQSDKKFEIEKSWSIRDIEGYLNTWSGVAHYRKQHEVNPVDSFILDLEDVWGPYENVIFPIFLRLGLV